MTARALRSLLLFVLAAASFAAPFEVDVRPGDLIYIALGGAAGGAISGSSGSVASHIGVAATDPTGAVTVIHAYGRVREEPLDRFLAKGTGAFAVNRLAGQTVAQAAEVVAGARAFLGWPYDRKYRMDNRELYCSELVYRAYLDGAAAVPVALSPMDFASAGEEIWKFWVRFFQGDVPQGEPGISPGDYLDSPAFESVFDDLTPSPPRP